VTFLRSKNKRIAHYKHLVSLALGLASLMVTQAQASDAYTRLPLGFESRQDQTNVEIKISFDASVANIGNPIAPLTVRSLAFPEGEVDVFYAGSLEISGGSPPYTVSVIKGSLPQGLNLDNNGMISGTPSQAKNTSFIVRVADQVGTSVSKKLEIKILKAPEVTTKRLKSGKVGKKYSDLLKATGGKKPFTWVLVIGSLPKGLSYYSSTGEITGAPTISGKFHLTFQVTDLLGGTSRKDFVLLID